MLKIIVKSAILVFIILSVYFIVNPQACSNLMLGRVVNSTDKEPAARNFDADHGELFVPAGDRTQVSGSQETSQVDNTSANAQTEQVPAVVDTNTLTEEQPSHDHPTYSQEDIDYAIASRYVELENEYASKNKLNKDAAKEISYQVMDDFELTPQEWESFLQRATQTNLFNQIRTEMQEK